MPESFAVSAATAPSAGAGQSLPGGAVKAKSTSMSRFILDLIQPYRGWLAIVFAAMVVETAMSLAGPWPIKVIIDNVVGSHPLPHWLSWLWDLPVAKDKMGLALLAGLATVLIAAIGSAADYVDNYYTESVGQWVAHDLRVRVYDHLHRLSLTFYDHQQTGPLLSTITSDVATVQNFASSATLGILVDLLTIVMMLGLMFWLEWDFALIAIGVTPTAISAKSHSSQNMSPSIITIVSRSTTMESVADDAKFWTVVTSLVIVDRSGPVCW